VYLASTRQNGRDAGGPRRAAAVAATSLRGRDGDGLALRVLEPEDDLDESVRGLFLEEVTGVRDRRVDPAPRARDAPLRIPERAIEPLSVEDAETRAVRGGRLAAGTAALSWEQARVVAGEATVPIAVIPLIYTTGTKPMISAPPSRRYRTGLLTTGTPSSDAAARAFGAVAPCPDRRRQQADVVAR
jgi:hypothetical protein